MLAVLGRMQGERERPRTRVWRVLVRAGRPRRFSGTVALAGGRREGRGRGEGLRLRRGMGGEVGYLGLGLGLGEESVGFGVVVGYVVVRCGSALRVPFSQSQF